MAGVDIEQLIGALQTLFTAEELVIAERKIRDHSGTVPDSQLIEKIGLAITVHCGRGAYPKLAGS